MRIIKEGKIKKENYILNCPACGCVFEADKGDYEVRFDFNERYIRVDCPYCKNVVCTGVPE